MGWRTAIRSTAVSMGGVPPRRQPVLRSIRRRGSRPAVLAVSVAMAGLAAGCASSTVSGGGSGSSGTDTSFFHGKTITMIISDSPGGGFDTDGRLVAKYLGQQLHATVVSVNQAAAGGLVALNNVATAKPDGLTLEITDYNGILSYLGKDPGVHYDPVKFGYIGRFDADPRVLLASAKGPYKSIQDVIKSANVRYAGEGPSDTLLGRVMSSALRTKQIKYILGYDGTSAVQLAVQRGDANVYQVGYTAAQIPVKAGTMRALLVVGDNPTPALPGIPNLSAIVKGNPLVAAQSKIIDLGRYFVTGPGVPQSRVNALRQAFQAIMHNPAFHKEAAHLQQPLAFQSGSSLQKAITDTMNNVPSAFRNVLKASS